MTRSNPIQFSAGQRVTLPFRARWAYIDNPTGNTVLVREGNTDQPTTLAEADWWVPALGARVMPCNASEFGLGVGAPFSVAQAGLPTVALAIFGDQSEPMPSIGSEAALSVLDLAGDRTLWTEAAGKAAGFYNTQVPLPPDIHSVRFVGFNNNGAGTAGVDDLTVFGLQSGITYGEFNPISDALAATGRLNRVFSVDPSRDSTLEVDYDVIGGSGFSGWVMVGYSNLDRQAFNRRSESLVYATDGALQSVGATTDADTATTVIGLLKQWLTRNPVTVLPAAEQPLALAARTTSAGFLVRDAKGARGVLLILRITVASGTGGLTVQFRALDAQSNIYTICADAAAVIAAGTTLYLLYPFTPPALAGQLVQQVQQPLPERFAVRVNHGDATSYTYALDVMYLA